MRTKLSALNFSQAEHQIMKEIRDCDWIDKIKGKEYADKREEQPPLTLRLEMKSC